MQETVPAMWVLVWPRSGQVTLSLILGTPAPALPELGSKLPSPISFNTLTACDAQARTIDYSPVQKLIDQRRFPDAGLPSNEDRLPLAPHRTLQAVAQVADLHAPADKFPRRQFNRDPDRGRHVPDGCDELISSPRQRLDELRVLRTVPDRVADVEDVAFQHLWLDERIGPQGIEQFILRNQPTSVVNKIAKDSERLRR